MGISAVKTIWMKCFLKADRVLRVSTDFLNETFYFARNMWMVGC